ncbi:MAG: replicative DNA helicase [Candidatus Marinimicrobia bacterium]|jgi:replicative DNA helicase|nr:replicative DNA helicase [Candidatus Neomarinimicrobiota bacterium]
MAKENQNTLLKAPPQSLEAEAAVLGSMLSSREAVSKALQWLTPDHFYKIAHQKIFSAMVSLFNDNEQIDTISVSDILKKKKILESVGGAYFLTGLVESIPTTANVESYSKIVLEKSLLRQLIKVAQELSNEAYDDQRKAEEILDRVEQSIFSITQSGLRGGFQPIDRILHESFEHLDSIASKEGGVIGVPSGLTDLDDVTAGFHPGDLIVLAGRPSMGKTALALNIARNASIDHDVGVGFFSLEMANSQLAMRLLCTEARVDSHLVRTGNLPKNQWVNLSTNVGILAEAPIYLDDTPGISVLELRAKARRIKAEKDIGLVVVDYLQLMQGPDSESRQQEISSISRSLKGLAKELNLPVIALSQLSRAVENRSNRIPLLSDLRESGAIEQDADVVIFLYRPYLYTQEEEDDGKVQIIVAKQRNGPVRTVMAAFTSRYTSFKDLSYHKEEVPVPF